MRDKLLQIKSLVDDLLRELEHRPSPAAPSRAEPGHADFEELKRLLESPDWPEAVYPSHIADDNSEEDKEERAQGVYDIMLPPLINKKFLDYGCGEGHLVRRVSKEAALSVGYDIVRSPKSILPWEEQGGFVLTTDLSLVRSHAPFDVILLYDVIDHVEGERPESLLEGVASLLSEQGRIYMRCHPWCSRHGGHLYRSMNKAFLHLVFSDSELRRLGLEPQYNMRLTKPLLSYGEAIDAAGLESDMEPEIDSQEVEDFFRYTPPVTRRILNVWGVQEWDHDPPNFQMSQCFVDYVLKKK